MTAPDIEHAIDSLGRWLVFWTIVVAIGLLVEYTRDVAGFLVTGFRWLFREGRRPALTSAVIGGLMITLGVIGEGWVELRASKAETALRNQNNRSFANLGTLVNEAQLGARGAEDAAARANSAAQRANREAENAGIAAGSAEEVAAKARSLAHGARQEADSFGRDIVSAKQQAAAAESNLAEALRRAAEARAALNRIESPRSLTNFPEVVLTLAAFKGAEYTFTSVYADQESIHFLQKLDRALQAAGWKRVAPPSGFPAINVFGKNNPFAVPAALTNGVRISVDSLKSLSALKRTSVRDLPLHIRAAIALREVLSSDLFPPEGLPALINVTKGKSRAIRIDVGKKAQ